MVDIKVIEIPDEFKHDLMDLPEDAFADNVNKIFPIDCPENVTASAKDVLNQELPFYDKHEKLFIVERVLAAAKSYDIDVKELIDKGEQVMVIDQNSEEFKTAVATALEAKLKEIESGDELKTIKEQVAKAEETINELKTNVTTLTEEKSKVEQAFDTYKQDADSAKIAEARWATLNSKGFKFEKSADFVKTSLASMNDESFNAYVSSLEEARELAKASVELKKEIIDPVKESAEVAIASKVDDNKSDTSVLDSVLKEALDL